MASDAYVKIKDIQGQSTDDGHKDWIEILSHQHRMHMPIAAGAGGVRNAGRVNVEDFTFTKYVDKSSPNLAQAMCSGKPIDTVEIEIMSANNKSHKLLKYTLQHVYISSIRADHTAGQIPTEVVSLSFGKIKWEFTPINIDGKPGSPQRAGWDRDKNATWA